MNSFKYWIAAFLAVFAFVGVATAAGSHHRVTATAISAPKVTLNPVSQTVNAGANVTFKAAATGNPTPTVYWRVVYTGSSSWTKIPGATSTTLTLNSVTTAKAGQYAAVFTNSAGHVATSRATLTVNATPPPPPVNVAPAITTQPTNQTVTAGNSATFTAAASGTPTPTVQWNVSTDGGSTWNAISGATSTTLNVTNTTSTQNGYEYQAVFTNVAGNATTNAATLTVNTVTPPPPPPPGGVKVPPVNSEFQWILDHPLSLTNGNDMGTNGTLYTGGAAPAPTVFDIDGFDNPATTVAALHAQGKYVICYISVGTYENWRSDASSFPAGLLGSGNGWPGENWLNISPSGPYYAQLQAIMTARIQMCKSKGFDAVEFDNMDGSENSTGFNITNAQNNQYVEWLASVAHANGLAAIQKNYTDQSSVLQPYMDFALIEQGYQYGDIPSGNLNPYLQAGKPVYDVEYSTSPSSFCPQANAANVNGLYLSVNLDGSTRVVCR